MITSLDLQHLIRVAAILDGIPGDTDLPHAIVALEDALVCCELAFAAGISLAEARKSQREIVTREETRRVLTEHRTKDGE